MVVLINGDYNVNFHREKKQKCNLIVMTYSVSSQGNSNGDAFRHSHIKINVVGDLIVGFRLPSSPSETQFSNIVHVCIYLLLFLGNIKNTNTTSCKLH